MDKAYRRQGIGTRLLQAIALQARAMDVEALVGMCATCATRNVPMRRIFEDAGLTLTREDDDLHARRDLMLHERQVEDRLACQGSSLKPS